MVNLERVVGLLGDEAACWGRILELKRIRLSATTSEAKLSGRDAVERGVRAVLGVLNDLDRAGLSVNAFDAAHGIGHMTRDYLNAVRLFSATEAAPTDLLVGVVAGSLHDLGCALVARYDERGRAVRHAEAGAILLSECFSESAHGLSVEEQAMIEYAVAAHTNYLSAMDVKCADGVVRHLEPYRSVDVSGRTMYWEVFPRWVDRLDCNGPAWVGRHYLGIDKGREDYSGRTFYALDYERHMRPLLRAREEVEASGYETMLEHLRQFASSQNNASPHARYDYEPMITLRDRQTRRLERVIDAVADASRTRPLRWEAVADAWTSFLHENVEPTCAGEEAANSLSERFSKLQSESREAWLRGFAAAMAEYLNYAEEVEEALAWMPPEWRRTPQLQNDAIEDVIRPHGYWMRLLNTA